MDGQVQLYFEYRILEYCGAVSKGMKKGYGTQYFENRNKCYDGFWEEDKYCGKGQLYDSEGKLHTKNLTATNFVLGDDTMPMKSVSHQTYVPHLNQEFKVLIIRSSEV